jgi:hypothetical protein
MANQENIEKHKFKPGTSGNPSGRPPGIPNSKTILARFLALTETLPNPVTGETEEMTQLEIMYLKQIAKARKGDLHAMKEILDRYEGKSTQPVDMKLDVDPRKEILNKYMGDENAGETKETKS